MAWRHRISRASFPVQDLPSIYGVAAEADGEASSRRGEYALAMIINAARAM